MATLKSFVEDHQLIYGVLDALDAFTQKMPSTAELDVDGLRRFAAFFTGFADIHHASKEEQVLFPELERHGAPWEHGPLADARREHRLERYFMRTFNQIANQEGPLNEEDRRHLAAELREFLGTMREHLRKEDEFVVPLVSGMPEAAQAELARRMDEFDHTPPSADDVPELRKLAERLKTDYAA